MTPGRPFGVDETLYPFTSHWFRKDGAYMHYLDEGEGLAVVLLHGNPTWSFLYRDIIKAMPEGVRCLAPDYPGFGFSQTPRGYGFTPVEHTHWIIAWLNSLDLDRFVLVVQDWGGPIGLAAATGMAKRVAGAVILNTWCWKADWNMKAFSYVMGGPLGPVLQQRFNVFAKKILLGFIKNQERLSPEVVEAYLNPFPTPASRLGTYVFPREIRNSHEWLELVEDRLHRISDRPIEMVFGMDDPAFGNDRVLRRWHSHYPHANLTKLEKAGHYVQEDAPEEVVAAIRRVIEQV